MSHQKGFTIIELIVVVAVIVVLALIVTTSVTGYINKSKNTKVKSDITTLAKSMMIINSAGAYPAADQFPGFTTTMGLICAAAPDAGCSISFSNNPCIGDYGYSSYSLLIGTGINNGKFMIEGQMCGSSRLWCRDSTGALGSIASSASSGYLTCAQEVDFTPGQ
jgi:prepilin-type N-terminal cleavage/methylation domain-containing protein